MNSIARACSIACAAILSCAVLFATHAKAQDAAAGYPNKVVKLVIPYTPGAHADLLARTVAQKLSEYWGQPVVVENKPGGGGAIGTLAGSRAAPDGYTLLMTALGQLIVLPEIQATKPYNALTDFEPVYPLVRTPWVLYVNPSLPVNTLKEFVDYAKANPGKLNGATAGMGSSNHLANAVFGLRTGTKFENIHYQGSAGAITDLMAGRADFYFDSLLQMQHVRAGKLKALAVTDSKRAAYAPDVPSTAESGFPQIEVGTWFALFFPPGTPPAIVAKVNRDAYRAMSSPDVQERLAVTGFGYWPAMTPAEFKALIKSDYDKYTTIVKETGIRAE